MNYELAKQLKDAGFPIGETLIYNGMQILPDLPHGKIILKNLIIPTLSELIEACGRSFISLERLRAPEAEEGAWWASSDNVARIGKSPEEAVANLWLALNTK